MVNRRLFHICLAIYGITEIFYFKSFSSRLFTKLESQKITEAYEWKSFTIKTEGCEIRYLDPFDLSIVKFYEKKTEPFGCPGKPSFLVVQPRAKVKVDLPVLKEHYNLEPKDLHCFYRSITRNNIFKQHPTDDHFNFGPSKNMIFDIQYEDEFMFINCFDKNNASILSEYLTLVPNKSCIREKSKFRIKNPSTISEPLNIIFVGIDSISKLNFIRHFPKTRRYLSEKLNSIELHGYTKVADNTLPNIIPLLTGYFLEHYRHSTQVDKYFFDDLELLWKEFSKVGYITHFAEDYPHIATFNHLKLGFRDPPTDFYYRPMALAIEQSEMRKQSEAHCFNSKLEIQTMFDNLKKLSQSIVYPNLYFSFNFITRLTHDDLNYAGFADSPSLDLLQYLDTTGVLNNSVLFFFSDHGIRFGDILNTYIGKFEERMPMAYLVFPPWFYEKYPEKYKILKVNERRLTSPFDIHATFQHLLHLDAISTNVTTGEYGRSLFEEIPSNRTCRDAGILPHWCTCHVHTKVNNDSKAVVNAAKTIVDTVNNLLASKADCLNLTLNEILDARKVTLNDVFIPQKKISQLEMPRRHIAGPDLLDLLLTISTVPGGAIFEATLHCNEKNDECYSLDFISRINKYGNQSFCIDDSDLQKFCYCRNFIQSN